MIAIHTVGLKFFFSLGVALVLTIASRPDLSAQRKEGLDGRSELGSGGRVNIQPDIFRSEGIDVPLKFVFDYPNVVKINERVPLRVRVSHNLPILLRNVRLRVELPSNVQVLGGETHATGDFSNSVPAEVRTWVRFPLEGIYEIRYVIDGTTDKDRFSQERTIIVEAKK